jgi:hypothetical protein
MTRRDPLTTIVSVQPAGHIDYGPPDPTRLAVTVLDDGGNSFPVVIEGRALVQLAKLIRGLEEQFPGALRGH